MINSIPAPFKINESHQRTSSNEIRKQNPANKINNPISFVSVICLTGYNHSRNMKNPQIYNNEVKTEGILLTFNEFTIDSPQCDCLLIESLIYGLQKSLVA